MKKPRLTPALCRWLSEVDADIRRSNRRGIMLVQAFSDCHDGNLKPSEVAPLVRQRLLRSVPLDPREGPGNGLMGDRVTYDFTPRAIAIFWPDRVAT